MPKSSSPAVDEILRLSKPHLEEIPTFNTIFFDYFNIINFHALLIAGIPQSDIFKMIDEAKAFRARGMVMYVLLNYSDLASGAPTVIEKVSLPLEEFRKVLRGEKDAAFLNFLEEFKKVLENKEVTLLDFLTGRNLKGSNALNLSVKEYLRSGIHEISIKSANEATRQTLLHAGCSRAEYEASGVVNAAFIKEFCDETKAAEILVACRKKDDSAAGSATDVYCIPYRDLTSGENSKRPCFVSVELNTEEVDRFLNGAETIDLLPFLKEKLNLLARNCFTTGRAEGAQPFMRAIKYLNEKSAEFLGHLECLGERVAWTYLATDEGKAYLDRSNKKNAGNSFEGMEAIIPGFSWRDAVTTNIINFREAAMLLPIELWGEYQMHARKYAEENCLLYVLFPGNIETPTEFSKIGSQQPYPIKLTQADFESIGGGGASLKSVLEKRLKKIKNKPGDAKDLAAAGEALGVVSGRDWEHNYLKGLDFFRLSANIPGCDASEWHVNGIVNTKELRENYHMKSPAMEAALLESPACLGSFPSAGLDCYYMLPFVSEGRQHFLPIYMLPEVAENLCNGYYNIKDLLFILLFDLEAKLKDFREVEDAELYALCSAAKAHLCDCREVGWLQQLEAYGKLTSSSAPDVVILPEAPVAAGAGAEKAESVVAATTATGAAEKDPEMKALKAECMALRKRIADIRKAKEDVGELISAATKELAASEAKNVALLKQYEAVLRAREKLRGEVAEAAEVVCANELRNSELRQEIKSLKVEIRRLTQSIESHAVTEEVGALKAASSQLEREIAAAAQTRVALETDTARFRAEVAGLPSIEELLNTNAILAARLAAIQKANRRLIASLQGDRSVHHPAMGGFVRVALSARGMPAADAAIGTTV